MGCDLPIGRFEDLVNLTETERLAFMRTQYEAVLATCTDEDKKDGIRQSLAILNQSMVDATDGVPTSKAELMSTFLGDTRDVLSPTTRRSRPLGTVITELDTFTDGISVGASPDESTFDTSIADTTPDPDFTGITYTPSIAIPEVDLAELKDRGMLDYTDKSNVDNYDDTHNSCLNDLQCTYEKYDIPKYTVTDIDASESDLDVSIADEDITSGCANGDGLFDKLMTAIDSSINLQFKNSRLDNKTFGQFYATTISSAMQQTTDFLLQKKRLELEAIKLKVEQDRFEIDKERVKYDLALVKAKTQRELLEIEFFRDQSPLILAKLTQETKATEKSVELTTKSIEKEEATTIGIYDDIAENRLTNKLKREELTTRIEVAQHGMKETSLNGEKDRNLKEAQIEQARVGIRTSKFEALLAKYKAYSTKVQTEEAKATGASTRRVNNAEVQTKNKIASLYDQQRKNYIHGQRNDTLKLMKDLWVAQIDTLGAEGMVIEAIKGPEFSSRLERAALDNGV